jgi:signal transduction histidine kinase
VDKLNSISYAYHYRDLDSTDYYGHEAYKLAEHYRDGKAEALNNRAFVSIAKMNYGQAERFLNEIPELTDNQLELFVCDVQQMRLCQRRSRNREFYEFRERAVNALNRINEERHLLTDRQSRRLLYAESELAIVTSTYYYYVGLEQKSIDALSEMPDEVKQDTAQWLNYLYNIGAGGILTEGTKQDIEQQEFDYLLRCFQVARQHHYPYFAANAMEAMAEHLADKESRERLIEDNTPGLQLVNPEGFSDDMLPILLADNALDSFREFGDVYQIAGAYRTLASCYRAQGDYESALFNLEQSLGDTLINQAPDLVASIREQLSVAYAAVNEKAMSDENRNVYLDLQEQTRQDRYLEARAVQYDRTALQLNWMIAAVVAAIGFLVFSLWLFNYLNQRRKRQQNAEIDELLEQKQEQLKLNQLHLEKAELVNLEQRAKISLVNSITPLIDRMLYTITRNQNLDYVSELVEQINADNSVLTHWIQLRQGELSLHIESFPLQPLFEMVARARTSFQLKGVSLMVEDTPTVVKADRILTLFMLNTLADNARKFTSQGGEVRINAAETDSYVEVSVSDTGVGMSQEQLEHLFDHKPIVDDSHTDSSSRQPGSHVSHGFGLLNCRGIIEKYRKMSQIFSVCTLQAESQEGKGSRLFFRLPKGKVLAILLLVFFTGAIQANNLKLLEKASAFADSAYFSNVNGTYERTLSFADSCRYYLNLCYRHQYPNGTLLMQAFDNTTQTIPEIKWLHDSLDTNYEIILDIRNESAVAALALHEWQLYSYNNRIYTQLFKELSADSTLDGYCRMMQQSQTNKIIAVILLIVLALALIPAYYLIYYRNRHDSRSRQEQLQRTSVETLDDEIRRTELELQNLHIANAVLDNCLSTLKHETMYYPSRIGLLIRQGDTKSLGEVANYYRELYGLLSQQAMRQVERTKLHLKPLADGILGDETLVRYLFDILKKQSGQKRLTKTVSHQDDRYASITVVLPDLRLSPLQAQQLFTPAVDNIPFLLCRQIVRDHGEATNRRGCSIRAEVAPDGSTLVHVLLPSTNQNIVKSS